MKKQKKRRCPECEKIRDRGAEEFLAWAIQLYILKHKAEAFRKMNL